MSLSKDARRAERRWRKANDPWFGRRRKAGEHDGPTKASESKKKARRKINPNQEQ